MPRTSPEVRLLRDIPFACLVNRGIGGREADRFWSKAVASVMTVDG